MVTTVNECLLNQNDFDFLSKAHLVFDLSNKLSIAETDLSFILIFDFLMAGALILMIILAAMIRRRAKKQSNGLMMVAACGVIAMALMTYFNFNKVETIKSEIAGTNAALEALAKPDIDVFTACNTYGAVLQLSPSKDDPDFKSSYTQAISIGQQ